MSIIKVSNKLVKTSCTVLLVIFIVSIGQSLQLMKSRDELIISALEEWAGDDAFRKNRVKTHLESCWNRSLSTKMYFLEKKTEECEDWNSYRDLTEVSNKASMKLQSLSWPLSMVYGL